MGVLFGFCWFALVFCIVLSIEIVKHSNTFLFILNHTFHKRIRHITFQGLPPITGSCFLYLKRNQSLQLRSRHCSRKKIRSFLNVDSPRVAYIVFKRAAVDSPRAALMAFNRRLFHYSGSSVIEYRLGCICNFQKGFFGIKIVGNTSNSLDFLK